MTCSLSPDIPGSGEEEEFMEQQHAKHKLPVIGGLSTSEAIGLGAPATDRGADDSLSSRKQFWNHKNLCMRWYSTLPLLC